MWRPCRCISYCLQAEVAKFQCQRPGMPAPAAPGQVADVIHWGGRIIEAVWSGIFPCLFYWPPTGRVPGSGRGILWKIMWLWGSSPCFRTVTAIPSHQCLGWGSCRWLNLLSPNKSLSLYSICKKIHRAKLLKAVIYHSAQFFHTSDVYGSRDVIVTCVRKHAYDWFFPGGDVQLFLWVLSDW